LSSMCIILIAQLELLTATRYFISEDLNKYLL